ncbi:MULTISPECIES: MCE family protein [Mycolicibacterium]|jgi:phospholipid/cholesterol/gamma-HCH transport system substrate-binding protein|uniref:Virulence factor Mce family protein n=3 Tax=Mycolicibacterium TaxID=1866885 RepID=A1TCM6_MYCVP|nr:MULTISPECIES: MCE family protein [Mycolicibacterium]ABM14926.1 virulence factor Mce family protein [Mycolicibacterium vanbaalenii PYR-1]MCV7130606.1 MCE family protein [Mycolicibacterium vanbaalenii PYR-1]MDN4521923.1 MCE family protein [Mycolicibacterium austroafricanum]MDW5611146.1 MCE family protein [Mycolicibacterium sp. D5.8-2]PQP49665.1 MCE family protein [Mycolicibacterium austroafricanum]
MTRSAATLVKFTAFGLVMALLTAFLFLVFSDTRTGAANEYTAVFKDASRLKTGDTVRIAGIRVGTVKDVELQADRSVLVTFDADRNTVLTTGTNAAIRYLNLVGDRYLELVDTPDSTQIVPAGGQIPEDRTTPALDLDVLLGGLKPVIQGLNPEDVNGLTSALIQILQGQGGTLDSLFSKTSSFSNSLADNNQVIEELIVDLRTVLDTLSKDGEEFSGAIDKLEQLVSGLSSDRDPIGTAITALDNGTASIADLLGRGRAPLANTVDEMNRLAPLVDNDLDRLDATLQRLPEIYRKLARVGSYGAWFPYYICGISFRASDLEGRTVVFPWIKQEEGRCVDE